MREFIENFQGDRIQEYPTLVASRHYLEQPSTAIPPVYLQQHFSPVESQQVDVPAEYGPHK